MAGVARVIRTLPGCVQKLRRDAYHLLRGFAQAEYHFGHSMTQSAMMVDSAKPRSSKGICRKR